ncbi:MAG: putative manganese transporter, partial [Bacteroidales bacterium]
MSWDLFFDALRNSVLITGLVIVMMLMIEYINVQSHGKWFEKLQGSKTKQVILGSCLGIVPGCIGGFAAVSLYTHRLISFGALIAMMIASSGDEAFVLLAMIPKDAIILFAILFVIAVITGLVVNRFSKKEISDISPKKHKSKFLCDKNFEIHTNENLSDSSYDSVNKTKSSFKNLLNPGKERIILLIGVTAFIVALAFGLLEHEHAGHVTENAGAYVNAHENGH